MPDENKSEQLEVVPASALENMERASISTQVDTAKRYPRELSVVKKAMLSFATLDEETAKGSFYTLPPRKAGDKPIQGPSIRMAEIAMSCYKNLRSGSRVIADDGKMITAQGVCHDLENNVLVSIEVKRRVTTKDGRRYGDDMVVMTGNAACAIALRNAVFKVVPLALVKPVYEQAKKVALGDIKTLVTRRSDAIEHFVKLGVKKEQVFAALNVHGLEDIGLEEVGTLIGYANAIKDGESTVEEIFSPKPAAEAPGSMADALGAGKKTDSEKAAAETAAPAVEDPKLRKTVTDTIENLMLDLNWTVAAMIKHARAEKWEAPEKAKALSELPLATLSKLADVATAEKKARVDAAAKTT